MPVTSKVTYTKELLMDFYWFSLKRKVVFWSFFAFYNLFVIGCTLFMLNVGAELDSTFKLCLIIMSFLDVFVFLSYFVLPHFRIKKGNNIGTELTYIFYDNEFNIDAIGHFGTENSIIKYTALKKVIKNKNKIYLYINRINAFIVVLDELNYEETDYIKAVLTNTLGAKKVRWKI